MSNIRDLQKLRNTKNLFQAPTRKSRDSNPESKMALIDQFAEQNNWQQAVMRAQWDPIARTRNSKTTHRRGSSTGSALSSDRVINVAPTADFFSNLPSARRHGSLVRTSHQQSIPMTSRNQILRDFRSTEMTARLDHQSRAEKTDQISKQSFNVYYPIGKGGFGKVWKVQLKKSKQVLAMKEMLKAKIIQKKSVGSVMNERNLLAKVRHPFLVNMSLAFQDRDNLYLLMDYLDGGDLRYHIGSRRRFTEKETKFFVCNILLGLEYLHSNGIIHRDIKPENLVFDSRGYLHLTDLGVSRELREQNFQDTSGTPGYMAPEVMCRKNHSCTADYYAVGVIAYEFMLGRRPYNGANRKEIRDQIMTKQAAVRLDEMPFQWSPHAADFVNKLLIRNPVQRLGSKGIEEIKTHRWLADIDWRAMETKQLKAPYIPASIEDNYDDYKQQISEDTLIDDAEARLLVRNSEAQELFEGYEFGVGHLKKRTTSFTTNCSTEDNNSAIRRSLFS